MDIAQKKQYIRSEEEQDVLYATLREFIGVKNKTPRQSIGDNEFYQLVNAMPLDNGDIAGLLGHSANLQAPATSTYVKAVSVIRGNAAYLICFRADGGVEQVQLTQAGGVAGRTVIAPAGTLSPSATVSNRTVYADACVWEGFLVLIIDPVKGYFTWNGTTWTLVDNTVLGYSIAVFQGRVFIAMQNNYTILGTTGPTDRTVANGFATYNLSTSIFSGDIIRLKSSTSYLFICTGTAIGIINNISFVNQLNYFQLQPISDAVGVYPGSDVLSFDGMLLFASVAGIYLFNQAAPTFIGDDIAGSWGGYSLTYGIGVTCGRVIVNGRRIPIFLVGSSGSALLLANVDGKWFMATDNGIGINQIVETNEASGAQYLWGIASGGIYNLFSSNTTTLPVTIQSKLYDMGQPVLNKDAVFYAVEGMWPSGTSVTVDVDSEANGSQAVTNSPFTTSGSLQWLESDADNTGKYMGTTITFTSKGGWYISGMIFGYDMGTPWV